MDDLISRQAAIDAICKACANGDDYVECVERRPESTFCDEIVALRNLPSAQQWIPCSERPPEESGDYLVTVTHHSSELWVEVDQFDNENGSWWHYMDAVTAWMPLPEPYKGEE